MKKNLLIATLGLLGVLVAGSASATVVMNFDHLNANGEYVNNFYDGGCGASYNSGATTCGSPGDNYGVQWVGALEGGAPSGLYSNVGSEPSSPGVIGFLDSNNAYMNVAAGFTGGFAFWYSAPYGQQFGLGPFIVNVFSGLNGTGTLLGSVTLQQTNASCNGAQAFSCWLQAGVNFAGTAQSVSFAGNANYVFFDDITLGSDKVPVPEPAALGMFGLGLLLIGGFVGLRRRREA